jgi:hypothetical protein
LFLSVNCTCASSIFLRSIAFPAGIGKGASQYSQVLLLIAGDLCQSGRGGKDERKRGAVLSQREPPDLTTWKEMSDGDALIPMRISLCQERRRIGAERMLKTPFFSEDQATDG